MRRASSTSESRRDLAPGEPVRVSEPCARGAPQDARVREGTARNDRACARHVQEPGDGRVRCGRSAPKWLYLVRFEQTELWPDYNGTQDDACSSTVSSTGSRWRRDPRPSPRPSARAGHERGRAGRRRSASGRSPTCCREGRLTARRSGAASTGSSRALRLTVRGWSRGHGSTTRSGSGCSRTRALRLRSSASTPARRPSWSRSRTPPTSTTWSSARSAPATRRRCSARRPTGTRAFPTGHAQSRIRGACCASSGSSWTRAPRFAWSTRPPTSATSCSRAGPRARSGLDEAALAALVTRDAMIGVAQPAAP